LPGIAILSNPIITISFDQEVWQPIDVVVAAILVVALVQIRPRRTTTP
jgi:hypothetical protein